MTEKDNEGKEPMTHIFLKPCGCLSCAIVDVPEMFEEFGRAYRYAQKHGEIYKKVETEEVRNMKWHCPQHDKSNKAKQSSLL